MPTPRDSHWQKRCKTEPSWAGTCIPGEQAFQTLLASEVGGNSANDVVTQDLEDIFAN